jgi:TolB protein
MNKIRAAVFLSLSFGAAFIFLNELARASKLGLFQKHTDIGITPKKGTVKFDGKDDRYTVTGGGANMWLKTDAFEYVYKRISGDATLTADLQFVGKGVENHRKGALMFRQSLEPDSAYADVALHGDGLTSLQYRPAEGADTLEVRSEEKAPTRIRIERRGSQFTMAAGNPGAELKTAGPVTVAVEDPLYVGLAVCSHNAEVLERVIFSNVKLEEGGKQTVSALPKLLADLR